MRLNQLSLPDQQVRLVRSFEMKLPGAADAAVDIGKIRDYCLSPVHPRGRHKARVFAATLGLTQADADWLREESLIAAREGDAVEGEADEYGVRYTLDLELMGKQGRANVRSTWIVLRNEQFPRLTTCYVLLD